MTGLLEEILRNGNFNTIYKKVKFNKGSGCVDGMYMEELLSRLRKQGRELNRQITLKQYSPGSQKTQTDSILDDIEFISKHDLVEIHKNRCSLTL